MTYLVKEAFLTLQGEGANVGRPAVFCRFSGCNLWSGREEHRAPPWFELPETFERDAALYPSTLTGWRSWRVVKLEPQARCASAPMSLTLVWSTQDLWSCRCRPRSKCRCPCAC